VAWLETYLVKFAGTVVMVTHDRYFLNNVTAWILELEGGRAFPYEGNYERWLDQKQRRWRMPTARWNRAASCSNRNWLVRLNPPAARPRASAAEALRRTGGADCGSA